MAARAIAIKVGDIDDLVLSRGPVKATTQSRDDGGCGLSFEPVNPDWAVPRDEPRFPVVWHDRENPSDLERRWRLFRAAIDPELPQLPDERHLHNLNPRMRPE